MKLCIDCKHCLLNHCNRLKNQGKISLVDGKPMRDKLKHCNKERYSKKASACGSKGRFWVAR